MNYMEQSTINKARQEMDWTIKNLEDYIKEYNNTSITKKQHLIASKNLGLLFNIGVFDERVYDFYKNKIKKIMNQEVKK